MKIVFMGTSDFAVPCLRSLAEHHEVTAVFTQPDKPKGRGMKLQPTPVKVEALNLNIPVHQPLKIRGDESLNILQDLNPDCIVVVSYGQILPKSILDLPRLGCVNVHASLLPDYRGAAPIHWAILNGETRTGITTMFMDAGLDTGDMILSSSCPITADMTVGELHDSLALQGADLLIETLKKLEEGTAPRIPQDLKAGTYAPMISRELSEIDWKRPAEEICNQVRGLDPWPAAQTTLNELRIKLFRPVYVAVKHHKEPGTVLSVDQKGILIAAGSDAVLIQEIQGSGSKRMPVSAYILGRTIPTGARFGG